MTTLAVILPLVAVIVTAIVLHLSIKKVHHLKEIDFYTERFVEVARAFIDDPCVPEELKDELRRCGSIIDDRRSAKALTSIIASCEFHSNAGRGIAPLPNSVKALNEQQIVCFYAVLFYFLFALSYSDYQHGWRVRRWLASTAPLTSTKRPPYAAIAARIFGAGEWGQLAPAA